MSEIGSLIYQSMNGFMNAYHENTTRYHEATTNNCRPLENGRRQVELLTRNAKTMIGVSKKDEWGVNA